MIIRTFQLENEAQAHKLDQLVAELTFVKPIATKRITPADMALGIGRPMTDEEWNFYFDQYPNNGKGKTGTEILEHYTKLK